MMQRAAVDIGTNSTRLLIATVSAAGVIEAVRAEERITRLGEKSTAECGLQLAAMERVLAALAEYQEICTTYGIDQPIVFATSATREARNGRELVDRIAARTGWKCRVISGEQEALLSFRGVVSDHTFQGKGLVCDIGGGSTEFIFTEGNSISHRASLLLGSRRLTELYPANAPATTETLQRMQMHALRLYESLPNFSAQSAVSVGGTATTLALMAQKLSLARAEQAHGFQLQRNDLHEWIDLLAALPIPARKKIIGLHPDRADVILAGAIILASILDYYHLSAVRISLRDLLYGVLLPDNGLERPPSRPFVAKGV